MAVKIVKVDRRTVTFALDETLLGKLDSACYALSHLSKAERQKLGLPHERCITRSATLRAAIAYFSNHLGLVVSPLNGEKPAKKGKK